MLAGLYDKLEVYNLCRADFPVSDIFQRTATAFAKRRLMLYYPVRRADRLKRAPLVARLSAARLSAGFAKRLRPAEFTCRNAFLGRWDAAVAAVLFRLPGCSGRIVFVTIASFQFLDTGLGIGKL